MSATPTEIFVKEIAGFLGPARIFLRPVCKSFADYIPATQDILLLTDAYCANGITEKWISQKNVNASPRWQEIMKRVTSAHVNLGEQHKIQKLVRSELLCPFVILSHIVEQIMNDEYLPETHFIDTLIKECALRICSYDEDICQEYLMDFAGILVPTITDNEKIADVYHIKSCADSIRYKICSSLYWLPKVNEYKLGVRFNQYIILVFFGAYGHLLDFNEIIKGAVDMFESSETSNQDMRAMVQFWNMVRYMEVRARRT